MHYLNRKQKERIFFLTPFIFTIRQSAPLPFSFVFAWFQNLNRILAFTNKYTNNTPRLDNGHVRFLPSNQLTPLKNATRRKIKEGEIM